MSTEPSNELAQFHSYVAACLERGEVLSPEDVLDRWRLEHPSHEEFEESVEAIRQALAEMDAGNIGVPLAEFDRRFRERHGLS